MRDNRKGDDDGGENRKTHAREKEFKRREIKRRVLAGVRRADGVDKRNDQNVEYLLRKGEAEDKSERDCADRDDETPAQLF